jgi:hypothetical protein
MSRRVSSGVGATGAAAAGAGAAAAATLTGACCAAPPVASLAVALLGASGAAWAAGFQPYAPWLLGGSALLLGYGVWSVGRAVRSCRTDAVRMPRSVRAARWALAAAAALWLAAAILNLVGR